jgi:hypothetical protein
MLNQLKQDMNYGMTTNGAVTHKSTLNAVLDLFAMGGAVRTRTEAEKVHMIRNAVNEDMLYGLRCLFYLGDVRGGQGERDLRKVGYKELANQFPQVMLKNLALVPEFGRWDDLYALVGTKLQAQALELMKTQFEADMKILRENPMVDGKPVTAISILGKWLKSENTSSEESRKLAAVTRKAFGLSPKAYRKALTALRSRIGIVEAKMSAKAWSDIDYSKLPSKAAMQYRKAFDRNDTERYQEYLGKVETGEAKINTKALHPHEIVDKILYKGASGDKTLDLMWKNLQDYFDGQQRNWLPVVDVSGSMSGTPMAIAIAIGIYVAERLKGRFHNHFVTFHETPQLMTLKGDNISDIVHNLSRAPWGGSTNLEAVFDLLLATAVRHKLPQEEMPEKLIIVSDMEFNAACGKAVSKKGGWGYDYVEPQATFFETMKEKWVSAGYVLPEIVFWNANSQQDNVPVTADERGVQLVSGCSPSVFTSLLSGKSITPQDLMLEVLDSERYAQITV